MILYVNTQHVDMFMWTKHKKMYLLEKLIHFEEYVLAKPQKLSKVTQI